MVDILYSCKEEMIKRTNELIFTEGNPELGTFRLGIKEYSKTSKEKDKYSDILLNKEQVKELLSVLINHL